MVHDDMQKRFAKALNFKINTQIWRNIVITKITFLNATEKYFWHVVILGYAGPFW